MATATRPKSNSTTASGSVRQALEWGKSILISAQGSLASTAMKLAEAQADTAQAQQQTAEALQQICDALDQLPPE